MGSPESGPNPDDDDLAEALKASLDAADAEVDAVPDERIDIIASLIVMEASNTDALNQAVQEEL